MSQCSGVTRTIISSSEDSFLEIDRDGLIFGANESFCRLSGYTTTELIAIRFFDLEYSENANSESDLLEQTRQLGKLSFQTTLRRKNGLRFEAEVHLNYLSGQRDLFVAVVHHLGETKPPELELNQSNNTNSQLSYSCRYLPGEKQVSNWDWSAMAKDTIQQLGLDEHCLMASCLPDVEQCFKYQQTTISNNNQLNAKPNGQIENFSHLVVPIVVNHQVEALVGLIKTNGNFSSDEKELVPFMTQLGHEITRCKQFEERVSLLKIATDNSQVSIIITDTAGQIEYANPYFSKLTGYNQADYIGKNPRILQTGHHSKAYYHELWETILAGNTWEGEFYNRKKDGNCYWEKAIITPIKNEQGEIVNFVAVKTDITETKTMTQALIKAKEVADESRRWSEAIFYTSPVPISITKLTGEYVGVNEQFLSLSGYSKDEVIGKKANDIDIWVNPASRKHLVQTLRDIGHIDNMESSFRLKNNTIRQMIISAKLMQFGKEPLVLLASKDITQQKETEAILIATKEKAEESDRLKTTFLQNISHEIRTPMNAIMGFAELLADVTDDSETMQQYIRIINQRCDDLLVIINSILDISRIECGEIPIHNEYFDLKSVYDELLDLSFEKQRRLNCLHISVRVAEPFNNFHLTTDKGKLKQIFTNLIGNALKYTNEGSITIGHQFDKEGQLQFFVTDTGIGISQSDLDKLFIRFKQLEHNKNEQLGGNGLGLAISKGLVNALGGDIAVHSQRGVGSTFFFTIKRI